LDNVNSANTRGVAFDTNDDNQIDLFVGLTFNLSAKKNIDSDSLIAIIETITEDNFSQNVNTNNKVDISTFNDTTLEINLISRDDYILSFFNTNEDNNNEPLLEDDTILIDPILTHSTSDVFIEEIDIFEVPTDSTIESKEQENKVLTSATYYLIVGVFSQASNLSRFAKSMGISTKNTFVKDNLNYLYLHESKELNEIKQLRDTMNVDCWIYGSK
jgi:hypothetical protein